MLISSKNEIAKEVENFLIKAKIHLPCKNQLMRHVYSKYDKTQVNILETFATCINTLQQQTLKRVYEENILLPAIKKPIGEVNIKNIFGMGNDIPRNDDDELGWANEKGSCR